MTAGPIVRVEHLGARVGERQLLQDVSFDLPRGSMTVLLGPNGSGKTSLLRALVGILPSSQGTVHVANQPIERLKRSELARTCAYLPQQTTVKFALRVEDVVALGRFPHRSGWGGFTRADHERIEWALERVGLIDARQRDIGTLSGGERQRVFIARALAQEAPVLLLDEPIASLDIGRILEFMNLLSELHRAGHTILAALHDLRPALEFFPRALLLSRGRLVDDGPTERVLFGSATADAYGVVIERRQDVSIRARESV